MPLTVNGIPATKLAELLREHLKHRTLDNFCASAQRPESAYRRCYSILHGETQMVSLRVADELCLLAGHPEWLPLLD